MTTPILNLPELAAGQVDAYVLHNEALRSLEFFAVGAVESRSLTAPPSNPVEGRGYIPSAPATGAWAGQENQLLLYLGGGWRKFLPPEGFQAWVKDDEILVRFDGAAWVLSGAGSGSLPPGGTTGQVLTKQSSASGDADWETSTGGSALDNDAAVYLLNHASTCLPHRKLAISGFCETLKSKQIWNKISRIWLNAGDSVSNAAKCLKGADVSFDRTLVSGDIFTNGGIYPASNLKINFGTVPNTTNNYCMGLSIAKGPTTDDDIFATYGNELSPGSGYSISVNNSQKLLWIANFVSFSNDFLYLSDVGGVAGTRDSGTAFYTKNSEPAKIASLSNSLSNTDTISMKYNSGIIAALAYGVNLTQSELGVFSRALELLAIHF